jgi:hypothetical protein
MRFLIACNMGEDYRARARRTSGKMQRLFL